MHRGEKTKQKGWKPNPTTQPLCAPIQLMKQMRDAASYIKGRNQKLNEMALNVTAFMKRLITRRKGGLMPEIDRIGTNTKSLLCYQVHNMQP